MKEVKEKPEKKPTKKKTDVKEKKENAGMLPGMPAKDKLGKEAEKYLYAYEQVETSKTNLAICLKDVLAEMKTSNRFSIKARNSAGEMRTLKFKKSTEGVAISKGNKELIAK